MSDKTKVTPFHEETENTKPVTIINYTVPSIVTAFIFNYIFGFLAFYYTRLQKEAYREERFTDARKFSRRALLFILIGILVGLCTYTVSLTLYFTMRDNMSCSQTTSTATSLLSTTTTTTAAVAKRRTQATTTSVQSTTQRTTVFNTNGTSLNTTTNLPAFFK